MVLHIVLIHFLRHLLLHSAQSLLLAITDSRLTVTLFIMTHCGPSILFDITNFLLIVTVLYAVLTVKVLHLFSCLHWLCIALPNILASEHLLPSYCVTQFPYIYTSCDHIFMAT